MSTATRLTKSNKPATVDSQQTSDKVVSIGDKSATKSTVDFVAGLATVDFVTSVYRALGGHFAVLQCLAVLAEVLSGRTAIILAKNLVNDWDTQHA